jgi:hypothetical protein
VVPHVFISYSRSDRAYVSRLAEHLIAAGIPVWYDHEIAYGDTFQQEIAGQIDTCAAFLLVMTPAAENSEWVSREIARAELKHRPTVPLLLSGDVFFHFGHVNYHDCTGEAMPDAKLMTRLGELVGQPSAPPRSEVRLPEPAPVGAKPAPASHPPRTALASADPGSPSHQPVPASLFGTAGFLASIAGAIFLLAAKFSGWQDDSFSEKQYATLFSSSPEAKGYSYVLMALGVGLFAHTAFVALLTLVSGRPRLRQLRSAFYVAIATVFLTLLSAMIFFIDASRAEAKWLDVGFWGILITSVLAAIMLRLYEASIRRDTIVPA